MKIALAQLNYHVGNFENNTTKIIEQISKAKADDADLVVFAELAVSAYPPLDFLEFADFEKRCMEAINNIAIHCQGIAAIIGVPTINPVLEGKNLFNSACFIQNGKIKSIVNKTLLPTYDVFDEYRYFEPNRKFNCIELKGKKIALTICEDLWNVEDDPLYIHSPMEELIKERPDLIVNIAASPFDYKHAKQRKAILKRNALQYHLPIFYVNHVGAQTEIIFDGGSIIMDADGEVIKELKYFEEDYFVLDTNKIIRDAKNQAQNNKQQTLSTKPELIYQALTLGIRDYFQKMGFKKAVLGLSGGVDSALVTLLACDALGAENILPVMMPSEFSSGHSIDDSIKLCNNLGIKTELISVKDIYNQYLNSLKPLFKELPFNVAEENLQARIRGTLLMALSNKFGNILLNTSNKSELAVGYGTLYGDMCGGLSVIGDLYKTEVYELCDYINREKEIIPENILTKAPSAELRPGQKDSDSLPDYEILDKVLHAYIEQRKGPKEIIGSGYDEALVKRILKMVNTNEYKRKQFAPVLRISSKAFGLGRRMPIVGKYLS
ncbi:MAG: NAD+ synthase [Bacteroidetes bacterium]|nr:NAD+ synthase [Bacteroidota bacterium]